MGMRAPCWQSVGALEGSEPESPPQLMRNVRRLAGAPGRQRGESVQMYTDIVLGVLAIICALTEIGFGVRIMSELRSRGIKANPLLVRWLISKYTGGVPACHARGNGACTTALLHLRDCFVSGRCLRDRHDHRSGAVSTLRSRQVA